MTTRVVVVSTRPKAAAAATTVRSVVRAVPEAAVTVLDVDGWYTPVAGETVLGAPDVGLPLPALHRLAAALPARDLAVRLQPLLVRHVGVPGEPVLVATAGVVLLRRPDRFLDAAATTGLGVVARGPRTLPDDDRWPNSQELAHAGRLAPTLLAITADHPALDAWTALGLTAGDDWLDGVVAGTPHDVLDDPSALLSAWNLTAAHLLTDDGVLRLDERPVTAVDLSDLDADRPWSLRPGPPREARGRLSDHPALAALVRATAELMAAAPAPAAPQAGRRYAWDMTRTSLGHPLDGALRALYRRPDADAAPDPFDPAASADLRAWLTEPTSGRASRYVLALRASRPDLCAAFPQVPGRHAGDLVTWAARHARDEGYPDDLLPTPAHRSSAARRPSHALAHGLEPGVAVVGYLRGELGIGESARLMVTALSAGGVPHAAVPIVHGLVSRESRSATRAPVTRAPASSPFDTTLLCVNADLTPTVAAAVPRLLEGRHRIGMWYWEVEEFPPSQHGGFDHVDEVWVASDFVRGAIEPHSPVPVRTVTPPLPQRGPEPTVTRVDLGLPDTPLFLFSFDFLSTAERKNPWGLVAAFRAAFSPGEGPVLVIKSINAGRRPDDAERLRLCAQDRPDILLLEDYLDADLRDALVALCDVYISLHRSEGLGLTMAEAMAWGKPVIATGYSGNLAFMTAENSFLVPWEPAAIPEGAEPYPAGGTWADPDLSAAAAVMRLVLERPDVAAARGARAASDIATLHSAEAAGRRVAEVLALRDPAVPRAGAAGRLLASARRRASGRPRR
jgi:glycosyltransferase involved in cell wall biosynthesis